MTTPQSTHDSNEQAQRFRDFRELVRIFIFGVTGHDMDGWPNENQPDYHALYNNYDCPVEAGTWFCIENYLALDYANREDVEQLLDYYLHDQAIKSNTEVRDERAKPIPVLH